MLGPGYHMLGCDVTASIFEPELDMLSLCTELDFMKHANSSFFHCCCWFTLLAAYFRGYAYQNEYLFIKIARYLS